MLLVSATRLYFLMKSGILLLVARLAKLVILDHPVEILAPPHLRRALRSIFVLVV
jgi:hypothetical protein